MLRRAILIGLAVVLAPISVRGEEATRGPVTNLPLPRFVSVKAGEVNVRRGPSLTHRIDWVFKQRDMPVEITAEFENWRRVRDKEGAGGWVHYSLLSGVRTVIVEQDLLPLRMQPDPEAAVNAYGEIARSKGMTRTQLALSWCYHREHVASTIIGATSMSQLQEDIEAYDIRLDNETLSEITKVYKQYTDPTKFA